MQNIFSLKKILILLSIILLVLIVIILVDFLNSERRDVELSKLKSQCSVCATVGYPAISPSGKYELEIIASHIKNDAGQFNQFRIKNSSNKELLFSSDDKFYTRHMTYFLWDNDDRVWVYSGDVGTFYWTKIDETNWQKLTYYDDESIGKKTIPAPDFLKKVRPEYHKF